MENSITLDPILRIQEAEWIITLPIKDSTVYDIKKLVEQLRNPGTTIEIKNGWKLNHI